MASTLRCLYESQDIATTAFNAYTALTAQRVTVTKATATNHSGSAATITAYILPSGIGAVAAQYEVIVLKSIDAGATIDLSELRAHTLEPGDSIWLAAGTATAISVRISGQIVS